jgi:hypothetical protein
MFWAGNGEKCIIVQFLGSGKYRKDEVFERRDAECAEREKRKIETRPRGGNAPPDILRVNEPDRFVSG